MVTFDRSICDNSIFEYRKIEESDIELLKSYNVRTWNNEELDYKRKLESGEWVISKDKDMFLIGIGGGSFEIPEMYYFRFKGSKYIFRFGGGGDPANVLERLENGKYNQKMILSRYDFCDETLIDGVLENFFEAMAIYNFSSPHLNNFEICYYDDYFSRNKKIDDQKIKVEELEEIYDKEKNRNVNKLKKYEKVAYILIVVCLLVLWYFSLQLQTPLKYLGIFGYIGIGVEIALISIIAAIFRCITKVENVKKKVIILAGIYIGLKIIITVMYATISNKLGGINVSYEMINFILNIKNAIFLYGITVLFLNEKKKYIAKSIFAVIFIYFFVDILGINIMRMAIKNNMAIINITMLTLMSCIYYLTIVDLIKIFKSDSPKKELLISKVLLIVMALYFLSFINPFKYTGAWEYKNIDGKVQRVILLRWNKTVENHYSSEKLKYRINYISMPSQIIFYSENEKSMPLYLFGDYYHESKDKSEKVLYATNNKIYLYGNMLTKNSSWGISIENILFNIKKYYDNYKSKKLINAVLSNDIDKCKKIIDESKKKLNKEGFLNKERENSKNPIYYTDENGYNAMHYALISKNDKLINLFLDEEIPLYSDDDIEKYLFDIKYSEKTKEMVLNKLIYKNRRAVFAAILTTKKEPAQIINQLIKNKISLNVKDIDGDELVSGIIDSHIYILKSEKIKEKLIEAIDILFKNGFNPNTTNKRGENALSKVIKYNDIELTKYLLSKGYKLSFLEENQASPLFYMFESIKNRMEMLNLLIENNVKLDIRDKKNRIPLFNVFNVYNLTVDDFIFAVNIYKEHNIPINQYDSDGKNIVSYFEKEFKEKKDIEQNKIDETVNMLLKEIYKKSDEEIKKQNKKYEIEMKEIPKNKYKATYSTGQTEFVDNIIINENKTVNAHWVGYFEYDKDCRKNLEMSLSWSNVKITIDDSITIKSDQNNGSFIPVYFNKGIHKIDVELKCGWHTTEFSLKIKDIEKEYTFKELKEIIKPDKYDIYYVKTYNSEDKYNQIYVNIDKSENPIVLVLGSHSPIWWRIRNKNHNIKYILFNSYENGSFIEFEENNGTNIYKTEGIPFMSDNTDEEKIELEKLNNRLKTIFGEGIKGNLRSYDNKEVNVP